ncbi:hypothetical protein [Flavobacterium selenitireducens]|uniref:hypothetical protein n=1 Tax=Flavobacterium selenitireducens TaxID=2722704 RepID=UPI00168B0BAA|nr:hypothetical protein [Flavobacterium selenitireducens]MBD3582312.1 hypothetical protein [Flavobacterium selenitireducens]
MINKMNLIIGLSVFAAGLVLIAIIVSLASEGIISNELTEVMIPITIAGCVITTWILTAKYERSKKFRPHIEHLLREKGYVLISERPLNFAEISNTLEFRPTLLINGMPLETYTYKSRNERILRLEDGNGTQSFWFAIIIKTLKNEYTLELRKPPLTD